MVILTKAMDRLSEVASSTGIAGHGDQADGPCSGGRKLSLDCHETSSPLSSATDSVEGDDSMSGGTSTAIRTLDQIEISESLLAHKDTAAIADLDDVVRSTCLEKGNDSVAGDRIADTSFSSSQEYPGRREDSTHAASHGDAQLLNCSNEDGMTLESTIPDPKGIPKAIEKASASSSSKAKQIGNLRRGKWTAEEEAYVARVIQDFNSGHLDAPAGTTLRTYLSEKLKCDPMRITKKFTGEACIGKRVFHPAVRSPSNTALIDKAQVRQMINFFHLLFESSHRDPIFLLFPTRRSSKISKGDGDDVLTCNSENQ